MKTQSLQTGLPVAALAVGALALIALLALTGCIPARVTPTPEPTAGLPNPASVYCEEQGGRLEMRTDEGGGQYGVCIFPDGSECEEWAFFRGECSPGGQATGGEGQTVQVPDPVRARDVALNYVFDRYGEVVFPPPGANWTEENITAEGLVGASTFKYTAANLVVTVSFPIVAPDATIYTVVVTNQVSGFQWEGEVNAAGQVTERNVIEAGNVSAASYEGVSFSYDNALASGVTGEAVPPEELMGGVGVMPEHIGFAFEGYVLANTFHRPYIHVYAVGDLQAGSEVAGNVVAALRQFLAEKPAASEGIPFLPLFNAAQMMRAQVAYVDFQNGAGVRFLTQYDQAFIPINSHELFYTFQGLTSDGQYYVAAILPVSHPTLPADGSVIPGGDFDAFANNFDTYIADVVGQLDAQDASSFTPSLALLDGMIRSLQVAPTAGGSN